LHKDVCIAWMQLIYADIWKPKKQSFLLQIFFTSCYGWKERNLKKKRRKQIKNKNPTNKTLFHFTKSMQKSIIGKKKKKARTNEKLGLKV
jgi:hypothetical protein